MENRIYKLNVRGGSTMNMVNVEELVQEYGPYKMCLYVEYGHLTAALWAQYIELMVTKTVPITGPLLQGYGWAGDCVIPAMSGNKLPHFPEVGEITVVDYSPLFPVRVMTDYEVEMRYDQVLGHRVFEVITARVETGEVVDRRGLLDKIMPDFESDGVTADRRWYIRRTPSMSVALGTSVDRVVAKWL